MEILICLIIGYLLGSLSPAALFAKLKKVDMRHEGTGNLGATNTTFVLGKGYGIAVMVIDVAKSWLASTTAKLLFPQLLVAGLLAGGAAVVGHIAPFYMQFRGGKGLAAFGGMILAYDLGIFLILVIIAITLMIIVNYSCAAPISASVLFPILATMHSGSLGVFICCVAVSAVILVAHKDNIMRAIRKEDIRVRDFLRA